MPRTLIAFNPEVLLVLRWAMGKPRGDFQTYTLNSDGPSLFHKRPRFPVSSTPRELAKIGFEPSTEKLDESDTDHDSEARAEDDAIIDAMCLALDAQEEKYLAEVEASVLLASQQHSAQKAEVDKSHILTTREDSETEAEPEGEPRKEASNAELSIRTKAGKKLHKFWKSGQLKLNP